MCEDPEEDQYMEPQRCPHGRTFGQTCEACGRSVVAFVDPVVIAGRAHFKVVRQ